LIPTDAIIGTKKAYGGTVTTKYDVWGFPLHVTYFSQGEKVATPFSQYIYVRNSRGQIIEEIKPVDNNIDSVVIGKTIYQYNEQGEKIKEILPLGQGVLTWEYDKKTGDLIKHTDELGNISIRVIDPITGESTWQTTPANSNQTNQKTGSLIQDDRYCYSPPKIYSDMIPGDLRIASIDTKGKATGNAYNLQGKIIERFLYVAGGESHFVKGNEKWIFDKLTAGKRYEVFITWQENILNPHKTIFSAYQKDNAQAFFLSAAYQMKPPHGHLIGSLGQNARYQSIGRITASSNEIVIKAAFAKPPAPSSKEKIPFGTVRLVEIKTLNTYSYNKDGLLAVETNERNRKTEYFYDALGRRIKKIEQIRLDYNKISETYYDFAGRVAYWRDGENDIYGYSYDAVDNETERFRISPQVKVIEFSPNKTIDNKTQWILNKLDPKKRYEILLTWKPISGNYSKAVCTLNIDNKKEQVIFDPQTAPGLHPIVGANYRSLGAFESTTGNIKIDLTSTADIATGKIKIIEVQSEEQNRYDRGRLAFHKTENSLKIIQYDENYNTIKETTTDNNSTEERLYEYDKNSNLIKETIKDEYGIREIHYTPQGIKHKIIEQKNNNDKKHDTFNNENNNTHDNLQSTNINIRPSPQIILVRFQIEPLAGAPNEINANNCRQKFIESTPNMPNDWQVHHTKQACLRARYFTEKDIKIDELKYLRGVPPQIHDEISGIQSQFWGEKWNLFQQTEQYKKLISDNKNITEKQLRTIMYNCTPWDEIDALENSIDKVFKNFYIKEKAWRMSINKVLENVRKYPTEMHKNSRRSGVWNLISKKIGDLFSAKFPGKVGLAIIGGLGMIIVAKEIAVPSDTTQQAWNAFIEQYKSAIQEAENSNNLKKETAMNLTDKLVQYLQAVGTGGLLLGQIQSSLYSWSSSLSD
jgi:YD repeat-containing protein